MPEQQERTRARGRRHRDGAPGRRTGPDWLRLAVAASPGLARLHRLRDRVRPLADPFAVARLALEELEVSVDLPAEHAERIPASGAAVITANHPFGALDGLAGIDAIGRRRHDLRVLANPKLVGVSGIGSLIIPVDPFGGAAATRANIRGMREALRWLEGGGLLLIFPAGEVSNLNLRAGVVTDRTWSPTAARLIRLAGAPVTPMHFAGANSVLFQLAGIVHPRLRTLLLPHELANKVGTRVAVRVGEPLLPEQHRAYKGDAELAAQLRLKTYLAGAPQLVQSAPRAGLPRNLAPLATPVEPAVLAREVASLPSHSLLVSSGGLQVYGAAA